MFRRDCFIRKSHAQDEDLVLIGLIGDDAVDGPEIVYQDPIHLILVDGLLQRRHGFHGVLERHVVGEELHLVGLQAASLVHYLGEKLVPFLLL